MFGFLKKYLGYLTPRSRYISVESMNDIFIQTSMDIENALGGVLESSDLRLKGADRVFLLDFDGDLMASDADFLAEEITAVIAAHREGDEVFVRIESSGGAVFGYGYASSQIDRLRRAGIRVTAIVDRIAASGGYMMASVADRIVAAPFAVVGSVGVVAEVPNFSRVLKDLGVDYRQYTAGKFKRTVGRFTPISEEGEDKFLADLNTTHDLFKAHIAKYREDLDVDAIATGEHWYGQQAIDLGLVDEVMTSDQLILQTMKEKEVLKVRYIANQKWTDNMKGLLVSLVSDVLVKAMTINSRLKF